MIPDAALAPACPVPPPGENALAAAMADLAAHGWARLDGWLPSDLRAELAADAERMDAARRVAPAGIGRADLYAKEPDVRRARMAWLDGRSDAQARFFALAADLRLTLNRSLFLGLFEFEACYALYPEGGFYARHRDSLRGARNRLVSIVCYLNDDWSADWGGALRVFPPAPGEAAVDIAPHPDSVVLMLSEETEHEVLPTLRPRMALAGWWRVNASGPDRVDPPR